MVLNERWLVFGGLESIDVAAVDSQLARHDLVVRVCHALMHSSWSGLVRRVGVELQIDLAAAPLEDSICWAPRQGKTRAGLLADAAL